MIWQSFPFPPSSPLLLFSFPPPLFLCFGKWSDLPSCARTLKLRVWLWLSVHYSRARSVLSSWRKGEFHAGNALLSVSFAFPFYNWPLDATFHLTELVCADPRANVGEKGRALVTLEDRGAVVRRLEENGERVWAGEERSARNLLCKHGRLRLRVSEGMLSWNTWLFERETEGRAWEE